MSEDETIKHYLDKTFIEQTREDFNDFEDNVFVSCSFKDCSCEGAQISSVFVGCTFDTVNWYWCTGYRPSFINCTFRDCDLRGSLFGASFIRCEFDHCMTGVDNMGGDVEWEGALATDCVLIETELPIVPAADYI